MVQSTHELTIGDREVVKRFRSWGRDGSEREWMALTLLHRFSPGLAPEPLGFRTQDGQPVVVMSRVPGVSLGTAPLAPAQVAAVADAMRTMHQAVPTVDLSEVPERRAGPREQTAEVRAWFRRSRHQGSALVESAMVAAEAWVGSLNASALMEPLVDRVFSQGDGNLANFIWDGRRCFVVDFEDSGVSDLAYEVADLVEHVSVWLTGLLDPEDLVTRLSLKAPQRRRLLEFRRLMALFWLQMLMPGNRGHERNPKGSVERQAQRVLDLLAKNSVR